MTDQSDPLDELDPLMLELLVCPLTKAPLHYDRQSRELISERANLAYPVRGGVPVLLPSEARLLDDQAADHDSPDDKGPGQTT